MIRITSKQDGFRRAGLVHSLVPTEHDNDAFSKEQMELLLAEPMLMIEIDDDDDLIGQVVLAIGRLPVDDPKLWMKSGAPQAKALEDDLGQKVTAEQRDQAWKIYSEARG